MLVIRFILFINNKNIMVITLIYKFIILVYNYKKLSLRVFKFKKFYWYKASPKQSIFLILLTLFINYYYQLN